MPTPREILQEAVHLATLMVDQIEYVDLCDQPGTAFCVDCSAFMRRTESRDKLKRIVEGIAIRLQRDPRMASAIDRDSIPTAAELVAKAVKALIAVESPLNKWVLKHRFTIKFESIPAAWEQDDPQAMMQQIIAAN